MFGEKCGVGSLQNWFRFPETLAILGTTLVIFGAVNTIAWYLFNLKTRPTVKEVVVLIFFTHLTTILLLPFWEFASEHIFYDHKSV